MKTNPKWMVLLVALTVSSTGIFLAHVARAASTAPVASPSGTHERVQLTVQKVYSAESDGAIFRAYLVEWEGQQVIASDDLAKTNYQVGESIPVLVMKHPYPQGKEAYGLLHFTVLPSRSKGP